MKIIRLEAENVKRLRAVAVRPDGAVVLVGGDNGHGKTSLLDSIELALGGAGAAPPKVIRDGTDGARVVLELDDLVVERRWSANGKSVLELRSKDGATLKGPQGILDKLVGPLSFDPLAFMREPPKRQAEILRKLTGLDFTKLDATRSELYDLRRMANIEARKLLDALEVTPKVSAPEEEVSIQDILDEQQLMAQIKAGNDRERERLAAAEREAKRLAEAEKRALQDVDRLERELNAATNRLREAVEACAAGVAQLQELNAQVMELEDPDLAGVTAQLRVAEETNVKVRAGAARRQLHARAKAAEAKALELDGQLQACEQQRAEVLSKAKMPVAGLSFGDEGLQLNGIPLEQASSAEQLRVSLGMGIALNPQLRVILIRDGSLLDEKSLALVQAQAEAANAQVWIEVVGKDRPVGVLIEDGSATGPECEVVEEREFADG